MYCNVLPLFMLVGNTVSANRQGDTAVSEEAWPTYGYIALGALILIAIIVILLRKQHRKFNE